MSVIPQKWFLRLLPWSVCHWFHMNDPWGCYINLYVNDSTEMIPEVVTFDLQVTVIPQEWTLRLLHWPVCQWFHRNEPWGCYIDLYVSASTSINPGGCYIDLYVSDSTGMNPEVVTLICMSVIPQWMNPEVVTIDLVCQWFHRNEPWGCYINLYVSDSTEMIPEVVTLICMSVISQEWPMRLLH